MAAGRRVMQRRALRGIARVDVRALGHEQRGNPKPPRLHRQVQRGQSRVVGRVHVRPRANQALDREDRARKHGVVQSRGAAPQAQRPARDARRRGRQQGRGERRAREQARRLQRRRGERHHSDRLHQRQPAAASRSPRHAGRDQTLRQPDRGRGFEWWGAGVARPGGHRWRRAGRGGCVAAGLLRGERVRRAPSVSFRALSRASGVLSVSMPF